MKGMKIDEFLKSGLLEEYVLGTISESDKAEVERFIDENEEVRAAYSNLQNNLIELAQKMAAVPPPIVRKKILDEVSNLEKGSKPGMIRRNSGNWKWLAIAASFLCLLYYAYHRMGTLSKQHDDLKTAYQQLKEQCDEGIKEQERLQANMEIFGDANARPYGLSNSSLRLNMVAYINREAATTHIHVLNLPELPVNQCLQLWADIDGEMISMDIIPDHPGEIFKIPYRPEASSLNVTIEPKGGSEHPTLKNLIASVTI